MIHAEDSPTWQKQKPFDFTCQLQFFIDRNMSGVPPSYCISTLHVRLRTCCNLIFISMMYVALFPWRNFRFSSHRHDSLPLTLEMRINSSFFFCLFKFTSRGKLRNSLEIWKVQPFKPPKSRISIDYKKNDCCKWLCSPRFSSRPSVNRTQKNEGNLLTQRRFIFPFFFRRNFSACVMKFPVVTALRAGERMLNLHCDEKRAIQKRFCYQMTCNLMENLLFLHIIVKPSPEI